MARRHLIIGAAVVLGLSACGGSHHTSASSSALRASNALQNQVYQSKHNIEFRNYNLRQKVSDDPSTILWCTFFPPGIQGVGNGSTAGQAFTVPIAGKLTSSNKRPYDITRYTDAGNYAWYPHEAPGPDHMYGSSSEYRYGFDPTLTTYRIKGEYDAYMRDHFRGGVIRPRQLPLPYPTLNARKAKVC